jgi:hypothetical protein
MIVEEQERESRLLRMPPKPTHKPPAPMRIEEVTPMRGCARLSVKRLPGDLVEVRGADLGLPPMFTVHDLLGEGTCAWRTDGNAVRHDPGGAHVLEIP